MQELEYRILTASANTLFPLGLIAKDPDAAGGFPVSHIITLTRRLFEEGDLLAVSSDGLYDCLTEDGVEDVARLNVFVPSVPEIMTSIVERRPDLAFGMTSKAAVRWESFAQPDWDRYINYSVYRYDEQLANFEQSMWSRTRFRLEQAIRFHYSGETIPATELWSGVSPGGRRIGRLCSRGITSR